MHMPVIPREDFKGQTGHGDWADSLLELDTDFGALLDLLDELDLAGNTLVVFAGDNGPEEVLLWRGSPGYWEGSYFAGGEGNLRTPCIVRWPGHIPGGQVSDDIMHVTDWFTTLVRAAGAEEPADRVIDGVNQLAWLSGQRSSSLRDGYLYWMGPEPYGGQMAEPQAGLRRPAVLDRPRRQALLAPDNQPGRRPARTRAAGPALHALVDGHPLQPAPRRVPGQHRARATRTPKTPRSISSHRSTATYTAARTSLTRISGRSACRALGG